MSDLVTSGSVEREQTPAGDHPPLRARGTVVSWGGRVYVQGMFPGVPDEAVAKLFNCPTDTFAVGRGRVRNGVATFNISSDSKPEPDVQFELVRHGREVFSVERSSADLSGARDHPAPIQARLDRDRADVMTRLASDLITVMQSTWIEFEHGGGAEDAMQWILNQLGPPGIMPEGEWSTDAEAWYAAHRSDPFPQCHCGRPSSILSGGKGYCSPECESESSRADGGAQRER